MKTRLLSALLGLTLLSTPAAAAGAAAPSQAQLLFSALGSDRGLAKRAGDTVMVAVLFKADVAESAAAKAALLSAMQEVGKKKLRNLDVTVVEMNYAGPARLISALRARGVDAVYVTPGMSGDLKAIQAVTRAAAVSTLTGDEAYVREGLSVGVALKGGAPALVINAAASKAEGMDLDLSALAGAQVL